MAQSCTAAVLRPGRYHGCTLREWRLTNLAYWVQSAADLGQQCERLGRALAVIAVRWGSQPWARLASRGDEAAARELRGQLQLLAASLGMDPEGRCITQAAQAGAALREADEFAAVARQATPQAAE